MFGKFDSPNKKNENGKHQNPTTTSVFSGQQRDPNETQRPAASLHRPESGVYWEIPASDPASWIYEAETKRNETLGPNGNFRFTATTKIAKKNDRLQILPTKITCMKYQ